MPDSSYQSVALTYCPPQLHTGYDRGSQMKVAVCDDCRSSRAIA